MPLPQLPREEYGLLLFLSQNRNKDVAFVLEDYPGAHEQITQTLNRLQNAGCIHIFEGHNGDPGSRIIKVLELGYQVLLSSEYCLEQQSKDAAEKAAEKSTERKFHILSALVGAVFGSVVTKILDLLF